MTQRSNRIAMMVFTLPSILCTSAKESNTNSQLQIQLSDTCPGIIHIDVMEFTSNSNKPIAIGKQNNADMIHIPISQQHSNKPLQLFGFCYESQDDIARNTPLWTTIPQQILPQQSTSIIHLIVDRHPQNPTEKIDANPLIQALYGFENHGDETILMGSMPEKQEFPIQINDLCRILWGTYALLKSHVPIEAEPLLLPHIDDMKNCKKNDLYSPKIVALQAQFQQSCQLLELSCPSVNLFGIPNFEFQDHRFFDPNSKTPLVAALWFKQHQLFLEAQKNQIDVSQYLSHPIELAIASQNGAQSQEMLNILEKWQDGWQNLGIQSPH